MTISHENLIRRQQAVQDALASAAREGQPASPNTAADMEAYGRGDITTDEVRHRILARLHADPRYQKATRAA
ncbi:antitoxin VbhA family protein [Acetobacter okinawensis]|uniref:antitoxin VbhA family protein n=1 Tax=Acetobacter okinawensis TaxID=1076594 RepID=UPI001BABF89A|nr:antitoxin VbhA family protein [Acetobacter okinawensis]MBS0965843.1 antitoxin VbhA family protein [Acetobacter okinawensis]